ncbi:hypothetical protein ACRYI5_08825 [Furfurilactobacillus sp. WILCCON 0119]
MKGVFIIKNTAINKWNNIKWNKKVYGQITLFITLYILITRVFRSNENSSWIVTVQYASFIVFFGMIFLYKRLLNPKKLSNSELGSTTFLIGSVFLGFLTITMIYLIEYRIGFLRVLARNKEFQNTLNDFILLYFYWKVFDTLMLNLTSDIKCFKNMKLSRKRVGGLIVTVCLVLIICIAGIVNGDNWNAFLAVSTIVLAVTDEKVVLTFKAKKENIDVYDIQLTGRQRNWLIFIRLGWLCVVACICISEYLVNVRGIENLLNRIITPLGPNDFMSRGTQVILVTSVLNAFLIYLINYFEKKYGKKIAEHIEVKKII